MLIFQDEQKQRMIFVMSGGTEVRNEDIHKSVRWLGLVSHHSIKLEKRKILNFNSIMSHTYVQCILF